MTSTFTLTPPLWLELAEAELGVCEFPAPKSCLRIETYHKSVDGNGCTDKLAWCSSFCNFIMGQAGIKGTGSRAARSWLKWGTPLKEPKFGCVVVLKRGTGWTGHVGFYVGSTTPDTIRVLAGNQSDKVCIQNFKKSNVLGYRWPK